MNKFLILCALLFTNIVYSQENYYKNHVDDLVTPELICVMRSGGYGSTIACVSKASIAKDKAQLKLIENQNTLIQLQIEEINSKKQNKTINKGNTKTEYYK